MQVWACVMMSHDVVSASSWNAQETLSTLRFGHATKHIHNTPTQNQVMGIEELEAVLQEAHKRIVMNNGSCKRGCGAMRHPSWVM